MWLCACQSWGRDEVCRANLIWLETWRHNIYLRTPMYLWRPESGKAPCTHAEMGCGLTRAGVEADPYARIRRRRLRTKNYVTMERDADELGLTDENTSTESSLISYLSLLFSISITIKIKRYFYQYFDRSSFVFKLVFKFVYFWNINTCLSLFLSSFAFGNKKISYKKFL